MSYLLTKQKIAAKKISRKNGQALILAYMAIVFFAILSVPLFNKIISERTTLQRQRLEKEAFYLVEGGVEDATNKFINAIANFQTPVDVSRYPSEGFIATTYTNSNAFPQGVQANSYLTSAGASFTKPDNDGTAVIVKPYIVTSTCQHPANSSIAITINQTILVRVTYAFQYAVFYNDDLELFPGKLMTFTGRISSNKDIYLGSDGSTLKIDSEYLRTAGNIYNFRKDGSNKYDGIVNIKVAGTSKYLDMHNPPAPYPDPLDSTDPDWIADSQKAWNGTVQTSANDTTKKAVPVVGSIQPLGYYNNNADIVVTTDASNGVITINKKVGNTMTPLTQAPDTKHNDPTKYNLPYGTVTTNTVNNPREGAVQIATIDLSKVDGYIDPKDSKRTFTSQLTSSNPQGVLIYATVNNVSGGQEPGVRLKNGSQISSSGLTVVTNDPLYIQGNYNTTNKPSAVICDSVNILSNEWQDGKNNTPTSTVTVNTAFIAGVDTTTNGNYNGGLENYPRLLENWGNVDLNITGCFVEMWNTQIAHGAWNTPGVYSPPKNRNWSYNSNFMTGSMPPFTPWTVEAQRSAWWKN